MTIEHVIYLSSAGCALWSWNGREFAPTGIQTPMGVDPAPLAAALRERPLAPVAIIVDMTDEEHVRETVPRLGRRDQQAMVQRKLARAFPRTLLRAALIQDRNQRDPAANDVFLSGLTRPEPVLQLLQHLEDARLPVAGIYTPAFLSEKVLDAEARAAESLLLVLRRANGRLQHSYFRRGRLAGSRRLRATAGPALSDPTVMVRQLEESLRYFDPTLNVSDERPLPVLLAQSDLELLSQSPLFPEGWRLRPFDMAQARRRLRIGADIAATDSDRLFIEMLRRHAPGESFAAPSHLRYEQLFRQRVAARAATLVLGAGALVAIAANALSIHESRQASAEADFRSRLIESRLPTAGDTAAGVDPFEMQRVVQAFDTIRQHQAEPAAVLAAVGHALGQRPRIQLDALRWHGGDATVDEATADAGAGEENADAVPEEASAGEIAPADPRLVRVTVRGKVRPFRGDYLDAFDEIDALVEALSAEPGVRAVRQVETPLNVDPAAGFSGEISRDNPQALEAPFTLELDMRLDDGQA